MKIVHALRGFEATSGISLFVSEILGRQICAGNDCTFVYQRALEYPLDERAHVVQSDGDLDVLGFIPDVVHLHSIWTPFSVRVMWWCRRHRVPYVVSIHGCLMPWVLRRGWIKKRVFLEVFLRRSIELALAVHVTTHLEAEACRKIGIKNILVELPLGVNIPSSVEHGEKFSKTLLFLSRISPEKGLVNLLDAWKMIDHKAWKLVIAGPDWFSHRVELEKKVAAEMIEDVSFTGAVFGDDKDAAYRAADGFVLPSYTENFSAVVADALVYGVPVIATKGTPWKCLVERQCGWWVDIGVEPLKTALQELIHLDRDELCKMGSRGRQYAIEHFNWDSTSSELLKVYRNVK